MGYIRNKNFSLMRTFLGFLHVGSERDREKRSEHLIKQLTRELCIRGRGRGVGRGVVLVWVASGGGGKVVSKMNLTLMAEISRRRVVRATGRGRWS